MLHAFTLAGLMAVATADPAAAAAGLARLLLEARRADEALPLLEAARGAAPGDPEVAHLLSRALVEGSGAERSLDRALSLAEESVERGARVARYHHQLGAVYARKAMGGPFSAFRLAGRVEDAFERAVALEPTWIQAHQSLLGFRLVAPRLLGGSLDRAAEEARAIERLDPLLGAMAWMAVHHAGRNWPALERAALGAAPLAIARAHRIQLVALLGAAGYPVEDDGTLGPLWLVSLPSRRETPGRSADAWAEAEASFARALALADPGGTGRAEGATGGRAYLGAQSR